MNNFKKHPIIYLRIFLYILVFLFATFFILYKFYEVKILFLVFVIFLQFFLLFIYTEFLNIELSEFILKWDKIFFLKKISILNREIIEINLSDIKEIKIQKKWILWDFFDYWKIILITKWWIFEYRNISNVTENSRKIFELIKTRTNI